MRYGVMEETEFDHRVDSIVISVFEVILVEFDKYDMIW